VQGLGGVGKTSLATEYAHRYRQLYAGVCWCPAETRTGLLASLAPLAAALGAASPDEAYVEKAAKSALRRLGEQRATWLLVYDNVNSPDEVRDLLPSGGARLLITSRFSDWSEWADELALDVLPLKEAIAFLQKRTARTDVDGAQKLATALGCLPLALDHAAAYCKRTQTRLADYTAKVSNLIAQVPRGVAYPKSVAVTFDLAINQAIAQHATAETLMAYLAQCAPERVPIFLVEGALDDEGNRHDALAALTEVSLVKHDPFEDGTPAVTVHRLVQAVARTHSQAAGLTLVAAERLVARLCLLYPRDAFTGPTTRRLCAKLTPHVLAQSATVFDGGSKAQNYAFLLKQTGDYLQGRAFHLEAGSRWTDALRRYGDDLAGARALYERALQSARRYLAANTQIRRDT
jgi:tetratricopeptide (TPR) repeat protein